jgi:hypothetical protein
MRLSSGSVVAGDRWLSVYKSWMLGLQSCGLSMSLALFHGGGICKP